MASNLAISDSGVLVDAMTGEPVSLGGLISVGSAYTQTYDTTTRTVPAPVTNSTTGSDQAALAAGAGVHTILVPIHNLATVADGDVITTLTPGYKFKILAVDAFVTNEVTTAAKASSLNLEIGTTNLTGGVVALTSANCATLGAKVAGTAVTAANTGTAADTISIEAASTTAFIEGGVMLQITIQNMDTADAFASLLADITTAFQLINAVIDDLQEAQAEA